MESIRSYKYLVVEDEPLIRKNIIKKIASLNLPFSLAGEASNGMSARLLVEKYYPDLVITDIRMPQYDGLELAEYLYKNFPSVKVILLSGYDDFSYAQTAIRFQVKDYLLKPVTTEALSQALQKLLVSLNAETKRALAFRADTSSLDQKGIYELLEKYLQEHFQEEISFGELGGKFGFTPEYLGKIFKKYSGETPSKYLTRLRMNEAKRLLLSDPDLEIQKIGELSGYKDSFYFSRAFKTFTGLSPLEFRLQKGKPL